MRLILHIGLPKTGTTSIQRTLSANRGALLRGGVYVPVSEGGPVPQFLHRVALGRQADTRVARFAEGLVAELRAVPPGAGLVVLSAEQCSLYLRSRDHIARLRDFLAPLCADIRVVVYLRRQDRHAASLYGQGLRRGVIVPPGLDFIASQTAGLFNYEALLCDWAAAFGEAALLPRVFEHGALLNGDVVEDFFAACGIDCRLITDRTQMRVNPSINLEGQRLVYAMGRMLQRQRGRADINDDLWHQVNALVTEACPGAGWLPDRGEAAAFMGHFAASNERVRARWFLQRAALFDMDFTALPERAQSVEGGPLQETAFGVILSIAGGRVLRR